MAFKDNDFLKIDYSLWRVADNQLVRTTEKCINMNNDINFIELARAYKFRIYAHTVYGREDVTITNILLICVITHSMKCIKWKINKKTPQKRNQT